MSNTLPTQVQQHPIAILSTTKQLVQEVTNTETQLLKQDVSRLYQKANWRNSTISDTLSNIVSRTELLVIRTDYLVVLDFDTDESFNRAVAYNDTLSTEQQCVFIVQSSRKGGHFYFTVNDSIQPPLGHTKQSEFDYLTGPGHNVIAPSHGDTGKAVMEPYSTDLTTFSTPWDMFLRVLIAETLPTDQVAGASTYQEGHSDDNIDFIKMYLDKTIAQADFDRYYNIPVPIPNGLSNKYYLQLSTRLGCDETISWGDYTQVMAQFNIFHQRKKPTELVSEIMDRMKPNNIETEPTGEGGRSKNGLWVYDSKKRKSSLTFTHKLFKTPVQPFYDIGTNEYIISYTDDASQNTLKVCKNKSMYLDTMEKIVTATNNIKKTDRIPPVKTIVDYSKQYGYSPQEHTFNKAIITPELAAFNGSKPDNYKHPQELLDVCKYMWGDEYEYMLSSTRYRYQSFRFSPVVTFLQGTEGSGKDLTVFLLTKGFPQSAQQLNGSLVRDTHANWQTEPNAIVSEVGDWRAMDKDSLLATIKTITGSHGIVTYRGMQQTAITVQSLIKVWVTGNSWVKLHNDPNSQRRIYPVYMPNPLSKIMGGPYTETQLRDIFSAEGILNFYYYLGNEYPHAIGMDDYTNPKSRQNSLSYTLYKEATESKGDLAAEMIYSREWDKLERAMNLFDLTLDDFSWKFNRTKNLVITVQSLKEGFREGGAIIDKTIDRLRSDKEGSKRLKFDRDIVEYFITFYNSPEYLQSGVVASTDLGDADGLGDYSEVSTNNLGEDYD